MWLRVTVLSLSVCTFLSVASASAEDASKPNGTVYDYPYLTPPDSAPYPVKRQRPHTRQIHSNWNSWLSNPYRPIIVRGQEEAVWLGLQRRIYDFSSPEERAAKAEAAAKAAAEAAKNPPPKAVAKPKPKAPSPFGWIGGIGKIGNPFSSEDDEE